MSITVQAEVLWKLAKHVTFGTKEHDKQEEVQISPQARLISLTTQLLQCRKIANVTQLIQSLKSVTSLTQSEKTVTTLIQSEKTVTALTQSEKTENCHNINTK